MSQSLERFLSPHQEDYSAALEKIRAGRKAGHWMWYIFPQLRGLGSSTMAWYYGIADLQEAVAYLEHPILGAHLREITEVLLDLPGTDPRDVFGWPDCLKLCSCMTLFYQAGQEGLFEQVLDKYYQGQQDEKTLELLEIEYVE